MGRWYNADGLEVRYGRDNAREFNQPKVLKTFGNQGVITLPFDLTKLAAGATSFDTDRDNDGTLDGFNDGSIFIPDQAHIESAVIYMTDTAAAGGTSVSAGLYQQNGTAIDADGLVTAANGATANLSANAKVTGSGADVATSVTEKAYPAITVAGTFTAGVGVLEIKYTLHKSV
jgi:hypothetical protein